MKIRSRVYLGAAITIVLVVLLLSAVFITSGNIANENKKHTLAMGVEDDIVTLNALTYEYVLYHEERVQEQWYLIYNSMEWVLEEELAEPLRDDYIELGDIFKQLTENYKSQQGASQEEIGIVLALERRLTTQLLLKSQTIATESSRICNEADANINAAQKTTNNIIIVLMAILAIAVSSTAFAIAESINRPIKKLMDGTRIIGKGNLDHRIGITSDDEIGELAVAFDDMTGKRKEAERALQKAHDGLELKVEERTEELTAANEELTASQDELHDSNEELTSINEEFQVTNEELTATQNELQTLNQALEARVKERTKKLRSEISERKKAQEDLKNTYEELKTLDKLKDDIIANVSHELRTPITIIRGAMEIAWEEDDKEQRRQLFKMGRDALNRQDSIIGNLLEAVKKDSGKVRIHPSIGDISHLITLVSGEFKPNIKKNEIEMDVHLGRNMPLVRADAEGMMHVLRNLIDNAIKFNKKGGKITIEAKENRSSVDVCISDTGIGIPEDQLDKIFERLYQLDPSSTRAYGGTGMGLAIAKEIVEAHGSEINVESTLGKGTKFCFNIPLADVED